MNRYITVRVDTLNEQAIDAAIAEGLQQLSDKHAEPMDLVNVAMLHRPHDGVVFVTVIAKGTGQKTAKPKKPKEQEQNQ
jgi:hypothetical protein